MNPDPKAVLADRHHPMRPLYIAASGYSPKVHCNDDHSSAAIDTPHWCPMHGYDDSVPAPLGKVWVRILRDNGQVFTALMPDSGKWKGDRYKEIQVKPGNDEPEGKWWHLW